MIRRIKTTAAILGFAIAFSGVCGCDKGTVNVNINVNTAPEVEEDLNENAEGNDEEKAEEESVELTDLTEPEETGNETSEEENVRAGEDDNAYGELYIDKINELKSDGLADQFALADIDADNTPELIASDSEGSFEHDNAFIFTIRDDEAVKLASVIAGVDGGSLDYSEGNNLIHVGGAVAGMRDVFYEIKDGELVEVFIAEATNMDDNAEYSVNGSDVDEEEYYKQINVFIEKYNPLTRIAFDGLYEINYTYEDGFGYFEEGRSEKYDSYDDITE